MLGTTENPEKASLYLDRLAQRLSESGFQVKRTLVAREYQLDLAAAKTNFEMSKLGRVARFVLAIRMEKPEFEAVNAFSSFSFDWAMDNYISRYSRGLLVAFPLVVCEDADEAVEKFIEENPPPRRYQAFVFPVIYSSSRDKLTFLKKSPLGARAFYAGFRKFVEETFSG